MNNNNVQGSLNQVEWTDFFSKEEVKQLNEYIESNYIGHEDTSKGAKDNDGNLKKNISTVKIINYEAVEPILSRLVKHAYEVTNMNFGYTTFGPFSGQDLLHATYKSDSKDYYDWHMDASKSTTYDVKMTLLINLSTEPYEGGEFQTWRYSGETHKGFSRPGSAFMFKSHILHKVTPVTSGTRKSLTMFIHGPKFK